jgi:hypothetical protein
MLISFQGYVYDITEYIGYHPGGYDLLLPFVGKNIDEAFDEVGHTIAAGKIIAQLTKVGKLPYADDVPQLSESPKLKEKWKFDYCRGMFYQMMQTDWTLADYNKYLEEPKTLVNPWRSVRMFDNWLLETITMGPWQLTPLGILPIVFYFLNQNTVELYESICLFALGCFVWTFFEYILHRHLFHSEQTWLPDHPVFIAIHFLLNGIHHAFPQDAYRLVFPLIPVLSLIYLFVYSPFKAICPEVYFPVIFSGILF